MHDLTIRSGTCMSVVTSSIVARIIFFFMMVIYSLSIFINIIISNVNIIINSFS